jgi:hypothetical protein
MHASPLAARGSVHDSPGEPRGVLGFLLLLFLLSCVFDPADRVLNLKVWLFVLCWVYTLFVCASSRTQVGVSLGLWIYTQLFILIPVLSIAWFWLTNGSDPFEGFSMLKGYLLIMLAPMLVLNRINLLPRLCAVLTVLAVLVIGLFIAMQLVPELYDVLYVFGPSTGIMFVDNRDYGSGTELLQVYVVTSPMLAISIAYYFSIAHSAPRPSAKRRLLWGLVMINVLGMLLAGTRNNILASLLLPVVLSFIYVRNKTIGALFSLALVAVMTWVFFDELRVFFDPTEHSNSAKLAMLSDYSRIFSDPLSLMFGQGLGAYQLWEGRGYGYVTELTYLELVRNFGLPGATVMLGLLLLPVGHAFAANRSHGEKSIALGFAAYLVMCISNPNLFSSMGILILSVILGNIFLPNGTKNKSSIQATHD